MNEGGYGGNVDHDAHLLYTLSAVQCFALFDALDVVSVDKVFPVEEVLQALDFVRRGENLGKVVMSVSNTATALDWFAKQLDGIKF